MSDFNLDFDLSEVEAPAEFELLPAGRHRAVVDDVDVRPDYSGDGKTLWVKLSFLDGDLQNRRTVAFLDIHSSTDWKQAKGRQMLVSLKDLLEIETLENFAQLISDKPVGVVIGHYKTKAGVSKDQVKGFCVSPLAPDASGVDSDESPF